MTPDSAEARWPKQRHFNEQRKQIIMTLITVPRCMAKLEYSAARLPFTLLEEHVVARYCDDEARLRLRFERFLGSLDGVAGWLLADRDISRRGQALIRRAEFLAKADELDTKAQGRRAQAEDKLQAGQAQPAGPASRPTRRWTTRSPPLTSESRKTSSKYAAWPMHGHRRKTAQAEQAAEKRAAKAEDAKQARQRRISAREDRVTAAPKQQLSDAAAKRTAAKDRRQEADRLGQLARREREARRTSNRPEGASAGRTPGSQRPR